MKPMTMMYTKNLKVIKNLNHISLSNDVIKGRQWRESWPKMLCHIGSVDFLA